MGFTERWDPGLGEFLVKLYEYHPKDPDRNSGNSIGVGVYQVSSFKGHKTTASEAYLSTTPSNLTIMTGATVRGVLFEAQKAGGMEVPGKKSEISILCSHDLRLKWK